jgi:hypothetical protein
MEDLPSTAYPGWNPTASGITIRPRHEGRCRMRDLPVR